MFGQPDFDENFRGEPDCSMATMAGVTIILMGIIIGVICLLQNLLPNIP